MGRLYINLSLIPSSSKGVMAMEAMMGDEQLLVTGVKPLVYCGACMIEMRRLHGGVFGCPMCGTEFERQNDLAV